MSTTTCANCDTLADWRYEPIPGDITDFCKKHVPGFVQHPSNAAFVTNLELQRHLAGSAPVEESKPSRKKASETASEEKEANE